jgi:hypothetical protein
MANTLGMQHTVSMSREELIKALRPPEAAPAPAPWEASAHELVRYAAVYAAACRVGNPAPMEAVTATVPLTVDEPAGYSKRMISEARRRGLLATPAQGMAGGELTARAKSLLPHGTPHRQPPAGRGSAQRT